MLCACVEYGSTLAIIGDSSPADESRCVLCSR